MNKSAQLLILALGMTSLSHGTYAEDAMPKSTTPVKNGAHLFGAHFGFAIAGGEKIGEIGTTNNDGSKDTEAVTPGEGFGFQLSYSYFPSNYMLSSHLGFVRESKSKLYSYHRDSIGIGAHYNVYEHNSAMFLTGGSLSYIYSHGYSANSVPLEGRSQTFDIDTKLKQQIEPAIELRALFVNGLEFKLSQALVDYEVESITTNRTGSQNLKENGEDRKGKMTTLSFGYHF